MKGAPVRQADGEEGGRRQALGLAQLLKTFMNFQLRDFGHIDSASEVTKS